MSDPHDDPEPERGTAPHERWLERHKATDAVKDAALAEARAILDRRKQTDTRRRA